MLLLQLEYFYSSQLYKSLSVASTHAHVHTHTKAGLMPVYGLRCGQLELCISISWSVLSLQEKTTLRPCWVCAALCCPYRAPSLWRASSPASAWSTSALTPAPRSRPARSSTPTASEIETPPPACLPGDAALTKTLLPPSIQLHENTTQGKLWHHLWIFCTSRH